MEIQKHFFELIKNKLPVHTRLADIISDILSIKTDSAYRRIRGEKELSLSEYMKLCRHFNVSLESALNQRSDNVSFKYASLSVSNPESFYAYKNGLATMFERIAAATKKSMLLTALDISVFHITFFEELSYFKDYTWFQNDVQTSYEQFAANFGSKQITDCFNRITNAYQQIPTIEIWTPDTLNPILNLLEYYAAMNCFEDKQKTFSMLCRQLIELIERVEKNAERGWKEYKGKRIPCQMYLSPLNIMNDMMIGIHDGVKIGVIKLHTINALSTDNEYFCSEIEKWLTDMQSKSLPLTGGSARERMQFFRGLRDKVYELEARVLAIETGG